MAYRDPEYIAVIEMRCLHCWHTVIETKVDLQCCFCGDTIEDRALYKKIDRTHGPFEPRKNA